MATANLLALLDDIVTVLDDVSVMTKVAAKKTAGVLGDDLALNAEQVSGVRAERELPVVWAVFKGSIVNKVILVPAALLISALVPWLVTYLLMLGGVYLCYEGVEKLWHAIFRTTEHEHHKVALKQTLRNPEADLKSFEAAKIQGAIRTDFVLSAEIIVIALGTVAEAGFASRVLVVSLIAAVMTVGVYGLVAFIVKLDDMGLALMRSASEGGWRHSLGRGLLAFCPWLMQGLSVVGTAAMFLVGGGILVHGIGALHHMVEHLHLPFPALMSLLFNLVVGVMAGTVAVLALGAVQRLRQAFGKLP